MAAEVAVFPAAATGNAPQFAAPPGLQAPIFLHPSQGAFATRYERNNKKGGVKALKCFPTCAVARSEHGRGTVCQDSVVVALPEGISPDSVLGIGRFVTEKTEMDEDEYFRGMPIYRVGDRYARELLIARTRTVSSPFNPEILATVRRAERIVEFNSRGWHYGWSGGRYKTHQKHQFEAAIFVEVPGQRGLFECVSVLQGSHFEVFSSRRANPNDKLKRRTGRNKLDAAKSYALKKESELRGQLLGLGALEVASPFSGSFEESDDFDDDFDDRVLQHGKRLAETEYSRLCRESFDLPEPGNKKQKGLKIDTDLIQVASVSKTKASSRPNGAARNNTPQTLSRELGLLVSPQSVDKMSPQVSRMDHVQPVVSDEAEEKSWAILNELAGFAPVNNRDSDQNSLHSNDPANIMNTTKKSQAPAPSANQTAKPKQEFDVIDGLIADLVSLEDAFGIEFEENGETNCIKLLELPLASKPQKNAFVSDDIPQPLIPDLDDHSTPGEYTEPFEAVAEDSYIPRDIVPMTPYFSAPPAQETSQKPIELPVEKEIVKEEIKVSEPVKEVANTSQAKEDSTISQAKEEEEIAPQAKEEEVQSSVFSSLDEEKQLRAIAIMRKLVAWHKVATKCEAKKRTLRVNVFKRQVRYFPVRV